MPPKKPTISITNKPEKSPDYSRWSRELIARYEATLKEGASFRIAQLAAATSKLPNSPAASVSASISHAITLLEEAEIACQFRRDDILRDASNEELSVLREHFEILDLTGDPSAKPELTKIREAALRLDRSGTLERERIGRESIDCGGGLMMEPTDETTARSYIQRFEEMIGRPLPPSPIHLDGLIRWVIGPESGKDISWDFLEQAFIEAHVRDAAQSFIGDSEEHGHIRKAQWHLQIYGQEMALPHLTEDQMAQCNSRLHEANEVLDNYAEAKRLLNTGEFGTPSLFRKETAEQYHQTWKAYVFSSWKDADHVLPLLSTFHRFWKQHEETIMAVVQDQLLGAKNLKLAREEAGKKGRRNKRIATFRKFTHEFADSLLGQIATIEMIDNYPPMKGMNLRKGRVFLKTLLTALDHRGAQDTLDETLASVNIPLPKGLAYECLGILAKKLKR